MGKFDNQLAHWREQHRIAVEDLEAFQSGERKIAEDVGEGWVDTADRWKKDCGTKLSSLHSWSRCTRSSTPELVQAGPLGSRHGRNCAHVLTFTLSISEH